VYCASILGLSFILQSAKPEAVQETAIAWWTKYPKDLFFCCFSSDCCTFVNRMSCMVTMCTGFLDVCLLLAYIHQLGIQIYGQKFH